MGFLNEELTDSARSFERSHGTDIQPYKRGTTLDILTGIVSGSAKGVVSTSNALSRFVEGDEVADKRMQQANEMLTPKAQGKAGHIASSIAEPLAGAVTGAPLGPYGMAVSAGLSTRASTHTYQTQVLGIDQETADIGANISGATMAAMTLVPMSNVLKNPIKDYALTVGGTTLAGQISTYAEGIYLDSKGYEKQGQMYKEMATDPTMIGISLAVGSAFWGLGRMRTAPNVTQAQVNQAQDQAHALVDNAIADTDLTNMPNKPETMADTLQHQVNLNTAIDQIMKGEKVSITEATGGALKTMDDVKQYLSNRTINSTSKITDNRSTASPIKNLGDGFVPNSHLLTIPLKANETTAGGQIRGYTAEFANLTHQQFGSNIKYFSSFNDAYHRNTSSRHAAGQAFDVVLKDPSKAAQTVKEIQQLAQKNGYTVKLLDEYANPSKNATGGHIHVSITGRTKATAVTPTATVAVPKLKLDPNAEVSATITDRVSTTYQLSQEVGFTPSQARALVGEIGRENGFDIVKMFGFHQDQSNFKQNGGIISWQGTRATKLQAFMQSKGLVNADGTFKRTNESLKQQLIFLKQEIEANPKWKKAFLDKKNITNEEARAALGGTGTIIGWRRGENFLADGKTAFDWKGHEAKADKFSAMTDRDVSGGVVAHTLDEVVLNQDATVQPRSYSDLDSTITRVDLDHPSQVHIDPIDVTSFEQRHKSFYDDIYSMEDNVPANKTEKPETIPIHNNEIDPLSNLMKMIDEYEQTSQTVTVPHTAKGVRVEDDLNHPNKDFKFDDELQVEWKERQRFENGKYYKEMTRSFKDKDGNAVQELKYRGSNLRRTEDRSGKTISIHVGRTNKSNFKDHKGNKELETALNRIFDTNNYGYLSQIPKGTEAIAKLESNPNLVISSKRTGEDFTAEQWKQKLQNEQDNIITMKQVMKTLATCALKQAS